MLSNPRLHILSEGDSDFGRRPDVSIIMPCLNEADSLSSCIENAREALSRIQIQYGLSGEIVVADNGSEDSSQEIAQGMGARVVKVPARGYGSALIAGVRAAHGRFLLMGDADGSYDFIDGIPMIGKLLSGDDLCLGSRFKGEIKPGAMPWKNRYIGNPILTGVLNLLFRAGIDDAHCGLRALTKRCFDRLSLRGSGMEFASEMVIKAALLRARISEVPVRLYPDLRKHGSHLRPWRDGWRHLRYLMMLSPAWLFGVPSALGTIIAVTILVNAGVLQATSSAWTNSQFGNYWVIFAGSLLSISHMIGIFSLTSYLYGIREGYRVPTRWTARLTRRISLETMLLIGFTVAVAGGSILLGIYVYWSAHGFARIPSVLPAVVGTSLVVIGIQNVFGGFLLAVIGGNEAQFFRLHGEQSHSDIRARSQSASIPNATGLET